MSFTTLNVLARRFLVVERGQTLVEYALIIALISIGVVGAMTFLQDALVGVFSQVGNKL